MSRRLPRAEWEAQFGVLPTTPPMRRLPCGSNLLYTSAYAGTVDVEDYIAKLESALDIALDHLSREDRKMVKAIAGWP